MVSLRQGGWGSIEYGTPVKGQVIGGRWKPLQHFLRRSVFATVGAACLEDGRCYVRNDGKTAFMGSLRLTLTELATGAAAWTSTLPLAIARGAHTVQWVCAKGAYTPTAANCTSWDDILADAHCTRATCVFNADVMGPSTTAASALLSSNQQLLLPPGDLEVVAGAVVTAVVGAPNADGTIPVTVSATATAVLVTLTTLASGVFSDNVFLLTQHAPAELLFTPYGPADADTLRTSLRIVHLAQTL
jgi:beta-mannosidase